MKLKKIVKHINDFTKTELYDSYGNVLWQGEMLLLQAAADTRKDKEDFIKECIEDDDEETVASIRNAEKFLNWKIFTDSEGESISCGSFVNSHGVTIPTMTIVIKEN